MKYFLKLLLLTNLITVPFLMGFAYVNMVIRLNMPLSFSILAGPALVGIIMGLILAILFYMHQKRTKILENEKHEEQMRRKEHEVMLMNQSRMAAFGGMIAAIAHQWKQPLNVISLVSQSINMKVKSNSLSDEFIYSMINQLQEQTKFMSNTIDDFRDFFRPDKEIVTFDLKTEVEKSTSILERIFESYFIDLKIDGVTASVDGVKNELHHVIVNILNNAKDVIVERGIKDKKISVNISKDEKNAYIKIKDNGGGIDDKYISKIFDPYFSTKGENGTGIGLYMTKLIVNESLNGKIDVHNDEEGAVFTVTLPLAL